MQTETFMPSLETQSSEPLSRLLLVFAAVLAALIYVGALLSPAYFTPEFLSGRPMAIFIGIGERSLSPELVPYQRLSSYIGLAAGGLSVALGLFLLAKAWTADSGKLLASSLIAASLGFALLHYFPFVAGRSTGHLGDLMLEVVGVVFVVVSGVYWARWTGSYPRPLTAEEFRVQVLRRYRFGRRKQGLFRSLRWGRLQLIRSKRLERKLLGKSAAFKPITDELGFLQRLQSEKWLAIVCAIAASTVIAPHILGPHGKAISAAVRDGALVVCIFFMVGIANGYLQYSYGIADETWRRKIVWLWLAPTVLISLLLVFWISAFLLLFAGYGAVFSSIMIHSAPLIQTSFGLAMVLAILFSIFSRGAIDPRLAISRTTIYGAIAVLMTSLFVVLEGLLSMQAVLHLGLPSQTGAIGTGIAATLMFGPLRNRIESGVNSWVRRVLPPSNLVEGDRRRSAVAFNDLSGYTALSETDERLALMVTAVFHREAYATAARHEGRVVKTIGDAAMLEFASVPAMVAALRELHGNFATTCRHLRIDALPVHSGVHFGEVFRAHDGDIYGQTVNLAARLEGVAGPNAIVLSEDAWRELLDREGFRAMGEYELKNVAAPVKCYGLSTV